jgi:hAT family C-terminal dimerisation region
MSTECERVFSGAKRTIIPERNRLSESVIEAWECLKAWWREGIVTNASPGAKKRKVSEMEHLEMEELPN